MKSRETTSTHKIALLSTGDEVANGDILNTNTREIAKQLTDIGMHVGMHAITSDSITEIEEAILYLLRSHQALIITGGLGPTSDDLTRYALSKAIDKPLIFDQSTWDTIVTRLQNFGYPIPPESNRQQALFPQDATIIPNCNGTAAGCYVNVKDRCIFMLPGPPSECLPMVRDIVIPTLIRHQFQRIHFHKSWMLFSVSEGLISEELDNLVKPYNCTTGYRLCYPYLEFKVHTPSENDFIKLSSLIDKTIAPYLISTGTQTASQELIKFIETNNHKIQICDRATGGLLESIIKTPYTYDKITFCNNTEFKKEHPAFFTYGLEAFWQQTTTSKKICVFLESYIKDNKNKLMVEAPFRGERIKCYAVEWICHTIKKELSKLNEV